MENQMPEYELNALLLGEVYTPGGAGVRLQTHVWVPGLPLYAGLQLAKYWGFAPDNLAGEPPKGFYKLLTAMQVAELRVGFAIDRWRMIEFESNYATSSEYHGDTVTTNYDIYRTHEPMLFRHVLYGAARFQDTPDADACPNVADAMLPASCSANEGVVLVAGYQRSRARQRGMMTAENGWLESYPSIRTHDLRVLFHATDSYGRDSFAKKLGFEYQYTFTVDGFAANLGFGWTGNTVILTAGLGYGMHKDFTGGVNKRAGLE